MKNFVLIILICIYPVCTQAQGWGWADISKGGGTDAWAVTTDHAGNVFGGGVIAGGILDSVIHFGADSMIGTSNMNAFWVKYSSSGTVSWAQCISGAEAAYSWLNNLTTDPSGNLIVFGSFSGDSIKIGPYTLTNIHGTVSQYFLAKISPSGTVLWAVNDGIVTGFSWTDILGVYIMSLGGVATDTAGNIYISSTFSQPTMNIGSYTLTNHGGSANDIFVAKYSSSGSLLWASSIGGTNDDYSFGMTVSAAGNVYITGAFFSDTIHCGPSVITNGAGYTYLPNAYIAEFSSSGTPLWGQGMGGMRGAFGTGLASDDLGNVYLAGTFADTSITFGTTTLTRTYPDNVPARAAFLVRYSSADSVMWTNTIGARHGEVFGFSIALARCGEVWVSGNYSDTATIGTNILPPVTGPDPIFIAGYDLFGMPFSYQGLGSGADDQNGIACDDSGNVFIVSDYKNYSMMTYYDFIVGTDTFPPASGSSFPGGESFYVAKYTAPSRLDTMLTVTITTNNMNGDTVCMGYPDTFIAHTNVPASSYLWYVNGWLVASGDSTYTYSPTSDDTIFCSVSGNPCAPTGADTSNKIVLTVLDDVRNSIVISASTTDTICRGDTVYFTSSSYLGGHFPTYSWKLNGAAVGTDSTWFYVPSDGDSVWCNYSSSYPCCGLTRSNVIIMHVDNCKEQVFLASQLATEVYPNPATSTITIQRDPRLYNSFTITNTLGQTVVLERLNKTTTQVDVSKLPAGIYFIALKSDNGDAIRRFVKI